MQASLMYTQNTVPSIQMPSIPSISSPTISGPTAPSVPKVELTTPENSENVKTTTSTTNTPQSELSTDLTVTALETISNLFTDEENAIGAEDFSDIGNFSSLTEVATMLNGELTATSDETTKALLQEILLKLSELETKIDNLESSTVQSED